jgi:uncharacterized membrane protein
VRSRYGLAALLLVMGVLHFVVPAPFMRIVPPALGNPRFWTYASGVAELVSGGLLLSERRRHLGGWASRRSPGRCACCEPSLRLDSGIARS